MISIIAAVANNGVIGKDNALAWKLPADLQYFKKMTEGCCIITGRKNYESIPERFRPLPNRINIVVTRQKNYVAPGAIVVDSIEAAIKRAEFENSLEEFSTEESSTKEIFIIGGAEIYKQSLHLADRMYLTHIHHSFDGDTFFPDFDHNLWKESKRTKGIVDDKNAYDHDFVVFDRVKD